MVTAHTHDARWMPSEDVQRRIEVVPFSSEGHRQRPGRRPSSHAGARARSLDAPAARIWGSTGSCWTLLRNRVTILGWPCLVHDMGNACVSACLPDQAHSTHTQPQSMRSYTSPKERAGRERSRYRRLILGSMDEHLRIPAASF